MAEEVVNVNTGADAEVDKKKLKEERKQLKAEQKAQKKEAKQRARELSEQISGDDEPGGISVFLVTVVIVAIWLAILCLLIKLDVGGFGSNVLAPVLKDVPVLNMILPKEAVTSTTEEEQESYGGYTSLREAVDYITELELELERAQSASNSDSEEMEQLRAEIERLRTFEEAQVDFDRIRTEFYNEVVYAENGPGAEEYQKYYESMDPTTAEYLYKQVIQQAEEDAVFSEYAQTYEEMKPKQAAALFETMTDDLDLVAKILNQMSAQDRGNILGAMDTETAARLTKIMDPDS
ncbi:MAG: hypothetical protein K2O13_03000 [Lachnospiraceae bacterium]|nr:hypothetical protein [Lachnospiraceae bacterium]